MKQSNTHLCRVYALVLRGAKLEKFMHVALFGTACCMKLCYTQQSYPHTLLAPA